MTSVKAELLYQKQFNIVLILIIDKHEIDSMFFEASELLQIF